MLHSGFPDWSRERITGDRGVPLQDELSMADHVYWLWRICFYYVLDKGQRAESIAQCWRSLVYSFILTRIGYCKTANVQNTSAPVGPQLSHSKGSQSVEILTYISEYMSEMLQRLHWLPMEKWIRFKAFLIEWSTKVGTVSPHSKQLCVLAIWESVVTNHYTLLPVEIYRILSSVHWCSSGFLMQHTILLEQSSFKYTYTVSIDFQSYVSTHSFCLSTVI